MNRKINISIFLTVGLAVRSALAVGLCEEELPFEIDITVFEHNEEAYDLRAVFPVAKLRDEPALEGLSYSARGWRIEVPVDDPTRTATIIAVPGTLVNGVFQPRADETVTVLPARQGEGTVDWKPSSVSVEKAVYRLTHTARINGTIDDQTTCIGYLDFTQCAGVQATQEEVETAVLDRFTHKINVVRDANNPWQPIQLDVVGIGVATDEGLAAGTVTTTAFSFSGRGILHYEYKLGGGSLVAQASGMSPEALPAAADWQARTIGFDGFGAHDVAFVYTAAGGDAMAALRNVRWEEEDAGARVQSEGGESRSDLREGVRRPKRVEEILPFTYSSTNWIGVAGATVESKVRVTIVQMTGTAPDVSEWTDEVPGTSRVLVKAPGEGEFKWKTEGKGVWKASFDILTDDECVHHEEAWFDLRKTNGITGFMVILR